jgi:AraC-like DNA-binding protein
LNFCDKGEIVPVSKGHLNPGATDVRFDRFELGSGFSELVRHVWVVRWKIPDKETRVQRVLGYPAFNAVIDRNGAALFSPESKLQTTELSGTSWAIGVLFRPSAGRLLSVGEPSLVAKTGEPLLGAPVNDLTAAMAELSEGQDPHPAIAGILESWLSVYTRRLDQKALLMNTVCSLAETDESILRSSDLAERVNMPIRSLERLVYAHIGLTPKWLIDCRRLQHAATVLFIQPATPLADLAASLGYSDYPHFSRHYKKVIGETPHQTSNRARNQHQ